MRIAVIGAGYVGLVSGACFAEFGHHVTCIDSNSDRIAALQRGEVPIYEPGLDEIMAAERASGRFEFSSEIGPAVAAAEAVFIAVGTPSRRGDGYADLSYVHDAARQIARAISGFTVVVTKSTVPVGTGDDVDRIIRETNPAADFSVASNPEFLREGAAIRDFRQPDRIVVGIEDERARAVMAAVYKPLQDAPILFTSRRTAELVKYASNAFLAIKVGFINEIADLCEKAGADVQDVSRGMGLDRRIGPFALKAGPGYGGSCLPKDTLALMKTAQDLGSPLRLVETSVAINDQRKRAMGRKVIAACGGDVRGKIIGVLGLTFKANTDDLRESPAIAVVQSLLDGGARVVGYDPEGMPGAGAVFPGLELAADAYAASAGASGVVIVTEWDEFKNLDLTRLRAGMADPVLVDLRNLLQHDDAEAAGFRYEGIGRPRRVA
jgi:UDPglucose 6-dehydrogenase